MPRGIMIAAPTQKRPSMRGAINAKCKDCIYDPLSGLGTWRQQVGGCTSHECPLWALRPMPAADRQAKEIAA
jgi:hypothetical protein